MLHLVAHYLNCLHSQLNCLKAWFRCYSVYYLTCCIPDCLQISSLQSDLEQSHLSEEQLLCEREKLQNLVHRLQEELEAQSNLQTDSCSEEVSLLNAELSTLKKDKVESNNYITILSIMKFLLLQPVHCANELVWVYNTVLYIHGVCTLYTV